MANKKLEWDLTGERKYETGVDRGVLYPVKNAAYQSGVAWNGLSQVSEKPSGGEETAIYADNIKYLSLMSSEDFGITIQAYMSPEEFDECDGTKSIATGVKIEQQSRRSFGFSYRTIVGNDVEGNDYAYKIHLVYGCKAQPSEKSRSTVNNSPEATSLSWEVKTTPVVINAVDQETGKPFKPTAHVVLDSELMSDKVREALEAVLYGSDPVYTKTSDESVDSEKDYYVITNGEYTKFSGSTFAAGTDYYEQTSAGSEARLPLPDELLTIINSVG